MELNLQFFGGRGASSDGTGPFGGGMDNESTTVTVKSSHPLTDEISTGGGGFANEIMNTRDAFEREYGSAVKDIKLSVGTFNKPGVLGAYGQDTLYMNQRYVKNANLTTAMQEGAKSGFHPSIGNKTGAEAVAAHEIGHRLGEIAAKKAGISQRDIVQRASKTANIKTENMAGHISRYARSNYAETIAEASADVFCNGNKASKASLAIMAEVKKILR